MRKEWTCEEKDFLEKNKTRMTNKKMAEKLGCAESQVIYALKKFNLQRTSRECDDLTDQMTGGKSIRAKYYHGLSNWKKEPIFEPPIKNKESCFIKRNMYKMSHKEIAAKL